MRPDWLFAVTCPFRSGCQQGVTKSLGELKSVFEGFVELPVFDAHHIVVLEPDVGYHMFASLEISRLGTVPLARRDKHQFPSVNLSSLRPHPHSPGCGNGLHQPPKL